MTYSPTDHFPSLFGIGLTRRAPFTRHRHHRGVHWRTGLVQPRPTYRLPAASGRLEFLEHRTPDGLSFAAVHNSRGLWSVVFEGVGWAHLPDAVAVDPALVYVKAITVTGPGRIDAALRHARSIKSPKVASSVIDEIARIHPVPATQSKTYLEVTYRGRALADRGARTIVLAELARRVPELLARMADSGGGAVRMVGTLDLQEIVQAAYDPITDRSGPPRRGRPGGNSSGPVAAEEYWDAYHHDTAWSITWQTQDVPRTSIGPGVVADLTDPQNGLMNRRAALLLLPRSPQTSTPLSLLVTATVGEHTHLDAAAAAVESAADAVAIQLRRCRGSQAAAFAATLPIGFAHTEHGASPDQPGELR
jgi:hypothetical protein